MIPEKLLFLVFGLGLEWEHLSFPAPSLGGSHNSRRLKLVEEPRRTRIANTQAPLE